MEAFEYIHSALDILRRRIQAIEVRERAETAGAVQPVAFAALPVAGKMGRLRYCTNCRKLTEGAGAGTGTVVYDDNVAWRRVGDDTTAAV